MKYHIGDSCSYDTVPHSLTDFYPTPAKASDSDSDGGCICLLLVSRNWPFSSCPVGWTGSLGSRRCACLSPRYPGAGCAAVGLSTRV